MRSITIVGDKNSGNGIVLHSRNSHLSINGTKIVTTGSKVTNHGDHNHGRTVGLSHITINNRILVRDGNIDTCGHRRQNRLNTMLFVK